MIFFPFLSFLFSSYNAKLLIDISRTIIYTYKTNHPERWLYSLSLYVYTLPVPFHLHINSTKITLNRFRNIKCQCVQSLHSRWPPNDSFHFGCVTLIFSLASSYCIIRKHYICGIQWYGTNHTIWCNVADLSRLIIDGLINHLVRKE